MDELIDYSKKEIRTINCGQKLLDFKKPMVMGIVNITPDSFYDGGKYNNTDSIIKRVSEIIDQGGNIIDIGGLSSRPKADQVSLDEELKRLVPAIKLVRKNFPGVVISIDTYRSSVARTMVNDFEVNIINDISAGEYDDKMFETIADLKVPYIIMHRAGAFSEMHNIPDYFDIITDLLKYFSKKLIKLNEIGVNDIIIDPGFGFSKSVDNNYEILKKLHAFHILNRPLLVGLSRKSMIYKLLNTDQQNALNGSSVMHTLALIGGANILRVHDVKEAIEVCTIYNKLKNL